MLFTSQGADSDASPLRNVIDLIGEGPSPGLSSHLAPILSDEVDEMWQRETHRRSAYAVALGCTRCDVRVIFTCRSALGKLVLFGVWRCIVSKVPEEGVFR
jgi:hypothetical protein